jgi:predicted esterase
VLGNGLVPGAFALGTVPIALLTAPALTIPGRARRTAALLMAMLLADLAFTGARLAAVHPGPPLAYCEDGVCGARPPFLAALIREDESAYAGIALTSSLGLVLPEERPLIERAAPEKYRRLDELREGRPGVNALLLSSTPRRVRATAWLPPGEGPVPGIVFLHGYGGSLTAYLSTLLEEDRLARYAIVAPALDWQGTWWSEEGLAVVGRTLDTLPPRIDRSRVYLVGLSNGAVGAVAASAHPDLGPRFRAVVAVEGLASADWFGVPRRPLLAIGAREDGRFPLDYMVEAARSLVDAGADVSLVEVEGTHMAFYTHTSSITSAISAYLDRHDPR